MKPTLYTGDNCSVCDTCKEIIKNKNLDIEIVHLDLTQRNARDLAQSLMIMGIPTLIHGDERFVGSEVIEYLNS